MKILDIIHEIVTTKKEKIGSGKEHVVYDYKADPTKIIKSAWGVDKGQYKYGADSNRHLVDMNTDHIEIFLKYPNLQVVLTGGDSDYLGKQLKSRLFANQNLLLYGLNTILNYNLKHNKNLKG